VTNVLFDGVLCVLKCTYDLYDAKPEEPRGVECFKNK
jgi:hypothetical protein